RRRSAIEARGCVRHLAVARAEVAVDQTQGEALRSRSGRGGAAAMPQEVAAVLVNYNAGSELTRALQSLADDLTDRRWEAVVVDNASSDGSDRLADAFAPRVRLLRNATNVGFGRAVNQGVAASRAPLVLIMNPDCRLAPGATRTLQAQLDAHEACAIVAPRVLDPDGAVQGSARGDPDML